MKKYLSIDLDYFFFNRACHRDNLEADFKKLIAELRSRGLKPLIVLTHDGLLDHIDESDCDHVDHIDFHADITFPLSPSVRKQLDDHEEDFDWYHDKTPDVNLNEGSFFWFVKNRENMTYHWWYPFGPTCHEARYGHCVPLIDTMLEEHWIFKRQTHSEGLPDLDGVTHVGISFSPDWTSLYGMELAYNELIGAMESDVREELRELIANTIDTRR